MSEKPQIVKFQSGICTCNHPSGWHEVGGGSCTAKQCECQKYNRARGFTRAEIVKLSKSLNS